MNHEPHQTPIESPGELPAVCSGCGKDLGEYAYTHGLPVTMLEDGRMGLWGECPACLKARGEEHLPGRRPMGPDGEDLEEQRAEAERWARAREERKRRDLLLGLGLALVCAVASALVGLLWTGLL